LLEAAVRGLESAPILDVVLDCDTGPTVDALASASREIQFALDAEISMPYTLNVSSPGADRSLAMPRQFRKHIGRTLSVVLGEEENQHEEVGMLESTDEEGIILRGVGHCAYSNILSANVILPW